MQYIVQFIVNDSKNKFDTRPSLNMIEADNLEVLSRKVEKLLKGTEIDEAVVYVPRCRFKSERKVTVTDFPIQVGRVAKSLEQNPSDSI